MYKRQAYCIGVEGLNQLDAQAGDLSGNQIMLTDFFSPSYLPRAMIVQKISVWNVSGMCLDMSGECQREP